jgi:hypothetical protein
MTALARLSNCKPYTRPLVREVGSHQETRNCLRIINIRSWAPDGCLPPRQTGLLTVGSNIALALTWTEFSCDETGLLNIEQIHAAVESS